jgi:hypothetical protein
MKNSILLMIGLLATGNAFAEDLYRTALVSNYSIGTDQEVAFGTTTALDGTCSFYGDRFHFDGETELGKQRLMTLLAAKATGLQVRVWYTPSTVPGTNQDTGCTYDTMAKLGSIGLE